MRFTSNLTERDSLRREISLSKCYIHTGRDSETQHPLETAGAGAEAALAGRVRYPEPAYHLVRGYPELQTQEAPASSSTILPSQERYRGVWCARAFFG